MNKINYFRQEKLFNPINQRLKIVVLGIGSLGSFITFNLAKLGFNDITIYDYDRVENVNLPNQFYRLKDIGKHKTEALKEIIKEFTDIDVDVCNQKVTKDTDLGMGLNYLYVLTFDTLKARKMVFDMLKENGNCFVIDARCGGEEYNIRTINLFNPEEIKEWEKSFDIKPAKLPCGEKSIIYTNFSVASEVCNIIKKINNEENYPSTLIRHMKMPRIIHNQK